MADVTNLDRIYYSHALMRILKWCQDLAMFCTQITLKDQQFNAAIDDLNAQWCELRKQRDNNYAVLSRQY